MAEPNMRAQMMPRSGHLESFVKQVSEASRVQQSVLARAVPRFGYSDTVREQMERISTQFKVSEQVLARAVPRFGYSDTVREQMERISTQFKVSEQVLARAVPRFGYSDTVREQMERISTQFKVSEQVLARAVPRFGYSDTVREQMERISTQFKVSEQVLARAVPRFDHLDRLSEQLSPLLAILQDVEIDYPNEPGLSQAGSDASEWRIIESEEHGEDQIGLANFYTEWAKDCLQAIAILITLFMVISVASSLGVHTNVAEIDETLAAIQALFVDVPHLVFNNPILGPLWFWVPIYLFVRRIE